MRLCMKSRELIACVGRGKLSNLPPLKDHQIDGNAKVAVALSKRRADGRGRSVLAVAPPGAGKSRCMIEMAQREVDAGGSVLLLVHRRMLMEQMSNAFEAAGLDFGVISPDHPLVDAPVQIASAQTLHARAVRRSSLELPQATKVLIDEAHQVTGAMARAILFGAESGGMVQRGYLAEGHDVVGFTATPPMRTRVYDSMVDFASYSELRRAGMHQLVETYGPDEIDTAGLKVNQAGEFSERDLSNRVTVIFGSVYREWRRLNPDALPTLLFAPSVDTSKWFATEFWRKGVPAAHIDADVILWPGPGDALEVVPSNSENREEVLRRSRTGEVKVVCNRFILREAIDMPWLYHAIAATVMGSITTALQSVGRLQRAWPGYSTKIFQDHGGFVWRHGSPNQDRQWKLGETSLDYAKARVERILAGEEPEGIRCPKCGFWRLRGPVCLNTECGHAEAQSVRRVRMVSGRLKKLVGPVHVKPKDKDVAQRLWYRNLYMMGKLGRPVSSAVAVTANQCAKQGVKVDFDLLRHAPPPRTSADYHLPVSDVFPWTVKAKA